MWSRSRFLPSVSSLSEIFSPHNFFPRPELVALGPAHARGSVGVYRALWLVDAGAVERAGGVHGGIVGDLGTHQGGLGGRPCAFTAASDVAARCAVWGELERVSLVGYVAGVDAGPSRAGDGRGGGGQSGVVARGAECRVVVLRVRAVAAIAVGMGDGGGAVVCVYVSDVQPGPSAPVDCVFVDGTVGDSERGARRLEPADALAEQVGGGGAGLGAGDWSKQSLSAVFVSAADGTGVVGPLGRRTLARGECAGGRGGAGVGAGGVGVGAGASVVVCHGHGGRFALGAQLRGDGDVCVEAVGVGGAAGDAPVGTDGLFWPAVSAVVGLAEHGGVCAVPGIGGIGGSRVVGRRGGLGDLAAAAGAGCGFDDGVGAGVRLSGRGDKFLRVFHGAGALPGEQPV